MNRLGTALVAGALASAGLLGLTTPASAAPTCADPDHPVRGYNHLDAAVGTRVTTFELGVYPDKGCGVTGAVAVVTSERHTYRVTLHQRAGGVDDAFETWVGDLELRPRTLRNSEAGTWDVRYEVSGEHPDTADDPVAQVVRASRLAFDAGPEPVRNGRITFSGRLERANWNTHRFSGISKDVFVYRRDDGGGTAVVATVRTRDGGSFRVTQDFPGPGTYQAYYAGGAVSASVYSRQDPVAAP